MHVVSSLKSEFSNSILEGSSTSFWYSMNGARSGVVVVKKRGLVAVNKRGVSEG